MLSVLFLLFVAWTVGPCDAKKQVTAIRCVPITECSVFMKLLQEKPIPTETVDFIRSTNCGFDSMMEKVWCAVVEDDPDDEGSSKPNVPAASTRPDSTNSPKKPPISTDSVKPLKSEQNTTKPNFKRKLSHDLLPKLNECGAPLADKVHGGVKTKIDEYPWLALLKYRHPETGFIFEGCGGSLINKQYVLTAAHCITAIGPPILVVLGEFDIWNDTDCDVLPGGELDCAPDPIVREVEGFKIHENWPVQRGKSFYNDIALLRLSKPVEYSEFIKPICLPEPDYVVPPNMEFRVAGWGLTETGSVSNLKLQVGLPPVSRRDCSRALNRRIGPGQLCAGGIAGKDTCKGDSGGPLMTFDLNRGVWSATGVVSIGTTKCGRQGVPAIYTFVPMYIDWIQNNLRP